MHKRMTLSQTIESQAAVQEDIFIILDFTDTFFKCRCHVIFPCLEQLVQPQMFFFFFFCPVLWQISVMFKSVQGYSNIKQSLPALHLLW